MSVLIRGMYSGVNLQCEGVHLKYRGVFISVVWNRAVLPYEYGTPKTQ